MGELPAGLIEIVGLFGALLGWAVWELRRNGRALEQMKRAGQGSTSEARRPGRE